MNQEKQGQDENNAAPQNVERRRFLGRLLGLGGAVSAFWFGVQDHGFASTLSSLLGTHHVDNAPPPQPVNARLFAQSKSLRFLAIGDWGTGDGFQKRVATAMANIAAREKPQFIISTGDNFYPVGVESVHDKQFRTKWEEVYSAASLQLPWFVALGNHDYLRDEDAEVAYSKVNSRWHMPGRVFSVKQENAGVSADIVVIDTQLLMTGSSKERQQQLEWLDKTLAGCSSRWKIVVGHHPIRSHGAYGDQAFMLRDVKPYLDKYGVHMYLNGHDHDLQYLKAAEDSFICVVSGGGGGSRNTAYGKNTRFAATNGGFAYIVLSNDTLHLQFVDAQGTVIYAADAVSRG